jgi:hypothetical protein
MAPRFFANLRGLLPGKIAVFLCCGGVVFLLGFLRFLGATRGNLRGEDEQECGGGVARGWLIIWGFFSHFSEIYFLRIFQAGFRFLLAKPKQAM